MDENERADQAGRAAAGDADALQRLIVHYHSRLLATVEGWIGHELRRHLDADDILQQAYVAAFKFVSDCTFDGPGGFYKWLETIALNQLRDRRRDLRSRKRDVGREVHDRSTAATSYPDLAARLTSPDSTPSRHLATHEAAAVLMTSLARLTDDQRQVIRLRFLAGWSVRDIAEVMDKTEPAIHALCRRGLKALKPLMGSITKYLTRA